MPYTPSPLDPGPSGAPVAPPTPPGVLRVDLDAMLREWIRAGCPMVPLVTAPLPIDLVEPDEPAPVGDRWPCHVFWAPMTEPLGPVLRPDSTCHAPRPLSIRPLLDHFGVPVSVQASMLRRPTLRARLRRFWDAYHEWIAVAVILAAAATAAAFGPRRVAAAPSPVPVASTPDLPRHA